MTDYEKQANDFLEKTGAKIEINFSHSGKHFDDDKEIRDIYNITISGGSRVYSFKFGNSLNNSGFAIVNKNGVILRRFNVPNDKRDLCIKKGFRFSIVSNLCPFVLSATEKIKNPVAPSNYDILACLTKYDPGTFEDFCSEFGYDTDSKKAEKTYNAVKNEFLNVSRLFSDLELEELQEIS